MPTALEVDFECGYRHGLLRTDGQNVDVGDESCACEKLCEVAVAVDIDPGDDACTDTALDVGRSESIERR